VLSVPRRAAGIAQTATVQRAELRHWVENVTVAEIVDAVWGRLPLEVRRRTTPAQVQASLTMITLRRGIAAQRPDEGTDQGELSGGPQS
jgi:hypothetical protein